MPRKPEDPLNPHTQHETTIDKINEGREKVKALKKAQEEEMRVRAIAINGVFNTPNGRKLWQHLKDYCGLFAVDEQLNPAKLVEDRGKRLVLLDGLRKHFEPKTINYLEK